MIAKAFRQGKGILAGILCVVIVLGLYVGCQAAKQWLNGKAGGEVPAILRNQAFTEEQEMARDYIDAVMVTLKAYSEEVAICAKTKDQPCQTAEMRKVVRFFEQPPPSAASWMNGAHDRLAKALTQMLRLTERGEGVLRLSDRAERGERSLALLVEIQTASKEIEAAATEWDRQSKR